MISNTINATNTTSCMEGVTVFISWKIFWRRLTFGAVYIYDQTRNKREIGSVRDQNTNSCINIYAYSWLKLLSNRPEAALKQQNPCSNHEIHVAFEHVFYFNIRIACCILFTDVTV